MNGLSFDRHTRRKLANHVFVALTTGATLFAIGALFLILYSLVVNGLGGLNLHVFTLDQPRTTVHDGDLAAEASIDLRELQADIATADDDEMFGDAVVFDQ